MAGNVWTALESALPTFFAAFDETRRAQRALVNNPLRYCALFVSHVSQYIDRHREELDVFLVGDLHTQCSKVLASFRWHKTVPKAYQWHVKSGFQWPKCLSTGR